MVNWISKCDHIRWLISLTSDNIKWLSLYLEFEDFFLQKRKKLPSYIAKNIKINNKTMKILRNIEKNWATLRHWKHWLVFQYIESQTLNSIQCQCGKLKHVNVNGNFFNVSMWNSMFNVDLQTLTLRTPRLLLLHHYFLQ
jgi:hypothetical protein